MKNKQTKSVIASIFLAASMTLIGTATQGATLPVDAATQAGAVNTAYANRTVSDLNQGAFTIEHNELNTGVYSCTKATFEDCSVAKENSFVYANALTGEYYVDFYIGECGDTGNSNRFLYINFGGDTAQSTGDNVVTIGIQANAMLNSEETAYVLNPNNRNGWLVSSYVRFVVNEQGNIDVYQEKSPIDTATHTPRGSYTLNNSDFSLTNGYFSISNGLTSTANNLTISVSNFTAACVNAGLSGQSIALDAYLSKPSQTATDATFTITQTANIDDNSILKSSFQISDEGVQTGEKVFEMTYTTKASTGNKNNSRWGVAFGLSEDDTSIDPSKAIGFEARNFYVCDVDKADICNCSYNDNWRTMTLIGYAGGSLKISCVCSCGATFIDGMTCEGLSFNGYFAFGVWATPVEGKGVAFSNFTFSGNTAYTLENGFEMDGASIRLSQENSGLRFTAQTLSSTLAELNELGTVEYGILYQDTTVLGENVLTLENYETLGAGMRVFASDVLKKTVSDTEYSTFNFAFYNIPEEAYTTERTVRFYAKVQVSESEYCVFYSDMISRSVAYVANCAYTDVKTAEEYAALSEEDKALYQYALEDGTYTRYSETQRGILLQYLGENTNA